MPAEPFARPVCSQARIGVPNPVSRQMPPSFFLRPVRCHSRMPGVPPDAAGTPPSLRSRLLAPSAPRRASACPSPTLKNTPPIFFFCNLFGAVPGRGGHYPRLRSPLLEPPLPTEPPARPERSQTRIGVPKSHPQKHTAKKKNCDLIGAVPGRGGHYPRLRSPLLKPPSPAEPPARPERSQTRIGVPKTHPQKHTAKKKIATSSALFPDAGALPASSEPTSKVSARGGKRTPDSPHGRDSAGTALCCRFAESRWHLRPKSRLAQTRRWYILHKPLVEG
ncbi:hypothetical protein B0H14DRAFT_2579324 [Mycena olivaceomarginata]|nr:hypothetical protein B0H14DRAFT_2579324 [Mycena olivaceomarginata]